MNFFANLWTDIKAGFDFAFGGQSGNARGAIIAKVQAAVSALKVQIAVAEAEGAFGTAERAAITTTETDIDAGLAMLSAESSPSEIQNVMGLVSTAIGLLPATYRGPAQIAISAAAVLIPTILAQAPPAAAPAAPAAAA